MNGVIQPQLFLDITGETSSFGDRGLLSIALDPDFATNNYVYMIYTLQPSAGMPSSPVLSELTAVAAGLPATPSTCTFNRVMRYTANGNVADPNSRFILLGKDAADGYLSQACFLRTDSERVGG